MSGQQWGTAIGTVVGAYFGYPQAGAFIGGLIGGAIDPEVIRGPDIGDAKQQHSQAGVPIPKALGMPPPFAGCIIDGDPISRKYTKRERQGKGGPVTVTEGFRATRAILVCEGEVSVVRIWRNNKLVYSRIAGDNIEADTASFASQIRIYPGSETQLPDPSLEAMYGVGNTPYYRGRCYVVIVDDDETQTGGAANQYLFQVTACEVTARYLEPGAWAGDADAAVVHQIGPTDGEQTTHAVSGSDKFGTIMSYNARHVWVINSTNGSAPYSISKVSTVDGSVGLTFPVTGTPRCICESTDGQFLFVGDFFDNSVVKYGTGGGGEIERTADLGSGGPYCVAVSGTTVVAGTGDGLKVIDSSDMSLTATISPATVISAVAVCPTDLDKVYACVSGVSGFLACDLSDNSFVTRSGPATPAGVCFIPDGTKAYFVGGGAGQVAVVTVATNTWARNFNVGASFEAIASSMNGDKLFAGTSAFGADLRQIDVATETVAEIYPSVRVYHRQGIAARPLP